MFIYTVVRECLCYNRNRFYHFTSGDSVSGAAKEKMYFIFYLPRTKGAKSFLFRCFRGCVPPPFDIQCVIRKSQFCKCLSCFYIFYLGQIFFISDFRFEKWVCTELAIWFIDILECISMKIFTLFFSSYKTFLPRIMKDLWFLTTF